MTSCELPQQKERLKSIHVPLLKDERGESDPATWPGEIHRIMSREIDAWASRNPDYDIVDQATEFDAVRRVCVTLFNAQKKAAA